jgi:hypothetical protein
MRCDACTYMGRSKGRGLVVTMIDHISCMTMHQQSYSYSLHISCWAAITVTGTWYGAGNVFLVSGNVVSRTRNRTRNADTFSS